MHQTSPRKFVLVESARLAKHGPHLHLPVPIRQSAEAENMQKLHSMPPCRHSLKESE